MTASVGEILQTAADVQQQGTLLLELSEGLNAAQENAVLKIIQSVEIFTNCVIELKDFLERDDRDMHSVSHNLRTPLVSVRGYPEMLLLDMYGSLTDLQFEQVSQLDESAARLVALVETLFTEEPFSS